MSRVTVAVRVRPINERERNSDVSEVLEVDNGKVSVTREYEGERSFNFDYAYSAKVGSPSYGTNERVYKDIGVKILDDALAGYNGCLFAYGQTGSGKSFTMTGYEDPGVIPRLTEDLFKRVHGSDEKIKVWVSYMEIYNEKIRDLLRPVDSEDENLNIFEHQKLGVIVPDATVSPVETLSDVHKLMEYGLKKRASAATSMNATSSRSHAIYTLHVEPKKSERLSKSGATGETQKEATMINQSLTNLGLVIKALSEKKDFVPFRNSKLTFLLKDSLSGNSRTYMIAAVSPALSEIEETVGTLRFASNVKKLVTNPRVNYGSHEDVVNALKAEITELRSKLASQGGKVDISGTLKMQQAVLGMIKSSFGKRLKEVKEEGAVRADGSRSAYILNVSDDPLLAGALVFSLPVGQSLLIGSDPAVDQIVIKGPGVLPSMAKLECRTLGGKEHVFVSYGNNPVGYAKIIVNGHALGGAELELKSGEMVMFGTSSIFRLVVPTLNKSAAEMITSNSSAFQEIEFTLNTQVRQLLTVEKFADLTATAQRVALKVDTRNKLGAQASLRLLFPRGDQEMLAVWEGGRLQTVGEFENGGDAKKNPLVARMHAAQQLHKELQNLTGKEQALLTAAALKPINYLRFCGVNPPIPFSL